MSDLLTTTAQRSAAQHRLAIAEADRVSPGRLASWVRASVRFHPLARRASEHEQDALAQMLAERIYRAQQDSGTRRRAARVGAAPVDRKMRSERRFRERYPLTAERRDRDQLHGVLASGNRTSASALKLAIDSLIRDSREWRDAAETHARSARRLGQTKDSAAPSVRVVATAPDVLSQSIAEEADDAGDQPVILAADVAALSDAFAAREQGTAAQRRNVRAALLSAAYGSAERVALALASDGERPASANAIRVAAFKGRERLAAEYGGQASDADGDLPASAILRDRIRAIADELGAWDLQAALEDGASYRRPLLSDAARAARALMDRIADTTGGPRAVAKRDEISRTADPSRRADQWRNRTARRVGFQPGPARVNYAANLSRSRPARGPMRTDAQGFPFPLETLGDSREWTGQQDQDRAHDAARYAGQRQRTVNPLALSMSGPAYREQRPARRAARRHYAARRALLSLALNRVALNRAGYPDQSGASVPTPSAPLKVPECRCDRCAERAAAADGNAIG